MMEVMQTLREGVTVADLVAGLGLAFVLGRWLAPSSEKGLATKVFSPSLPLRADAVKTAGFFALFLGAKCWLALVSKHVPEPYLDEVFHIPQAQRYCDGRLWEWDDKITTPPGLYLLSLAYHKLWMLSECTPLSLRSNNLLATLLVALLAAQCRHLVETRAAERAGSPVPGGVSFYAYHTGINIALMPVVFFFSALYYTDIASTLAVLAAYRNHLLRLGREPPSLFSDLWTIVLGVSTLFMRQTNVFWVVVYMGGSEAVHALRPAEPKTQGHLATLHDPPLDRSGPEDWLRCAMSIAFAALCNPSRVVRQIWPHVTVLALFAGFVAWNGGVVLGDKSNHIATIHLPQMLYIWPFFAFFSAPLILRSVISFTTHPIPYLQSLLGLTSRRAAAVSVPHTLLTTLLSLAAVHYNTIIHPFTLADNRHYMFYVFRRTVLRPAPVRLALVAAYTLARWLVWDQLAGAQHTRGSSTARAASPPPRSSRTTTLSQQHGKTYSANSGTEPGSKPHDKEDETFHHASSTPPATSTALLWLLATALSLVSAPLVEPRYFILPWVFYRLLVPAWSAGAESGSESEAGLCRVSRRALAWLDGVDVRLVLETGWFAAVNAVTMYVFLFRGFYWHGEDGGLLDGGRVQRFMW